MVSWRRWHITKLPRCLTERETMQLHGLDDFLKAMKPLVDEPQSSNMDEYHMINITSGITM